MEKASALSKKRNLEGNHDFALNPLSNNSFAVLSDNQIIAKASLMGVRIPDGNFDTVNLVRDLELARNSLGSKHKTVKPPSSVFLLKIMKAPLLPYLWIGFLLMIMRIPLLPLLKVGKRKI
jgi:hypothetical protein